MELSNEDKVTSLLSNKEILKKQDITYVSNVNDMNSFREYDLSLYIKTHKEDLKVNIFLLSDIARILFFVPVVFFFIIKVINYTFEHIII